MSKNCTGAHPVENGGGNGDLAGDEEDGTGAVNQWLILPITWGLLLLVVLDAP